MNVDRDTNDQEQRVCIHFIDPGHKQCVSYADVEVLIMPERGCPVRTPHITLDSDDSVSFHTTTERGPSTPIVVWLFFSEDCLELVVRTRLSGLYFGDTELWKQFFNRSHCLRFPPSSITLKDPSGIFIQEMTLAEKHRIGCVYGESFAFRMNRALRDTEMFWDTLKEAHRFSYSFREIEEGRIRAATEARLGMKNKRGQNAKVERPSGTYIDDKEETFFHDGQPYRLRPDERAVIHWVRTHIKETGDRDFSWSAVMDDVKPASSRESRKPSKIFRRAYRQGFDIFRLIFQRVGVERRDDRHEYLLN